MIVCIVYFIAMIVLSDFIIGTVINDFPTPGLQLIFGFERPLYSFSESVGTGFLSVRLSAESVQLTENLPLVFIFSTANGPGENAAVGEYLS